MTTSTPPSPTKADIRAVAAQHARVLELLGEKILAEATIHDILANADAAQIKVLLDCDVALRKATEQNTAIEVELEQLAHALIPDDATERSIKTPLGTIKLVRATALVAPEDGGDESVIALIEDWDEGVLPKRHAAAFAEVGSANPFHEFIRMEKKLNREALERLPDAALNVLRLRRVTTLNFSIGKKKLTAANAETLLAKARAQVGREGDES